MKKYKLFSFILVLVAIITLSMTVSVNASERVSAIDLTTYFGRILDSAPTQLINEAQIWYGERELADTEYADLPVYRQQHHLKQVDLAGMTLPMLRPVI